MGDAEALELKLRIVSQGQENLKQINDAIKSLNTSVQGASSSIDTFGKKLAGLEVASARVNQLNGAVRGLGSTFGGSLANQVNQGFTNPLLLAGNQVERLIGQLGPLGGAITTTFGVAAAAGAALLGLANSVGTAAQQLTLFAARTDLSLGAAQRFQGAARLMGVNGDSLAASMRTLASGLADSGLEGAKTSKALEQLGIRAYDVNGAFRGMDVLLPQILDGLAKIQNPVDRTTLAMTLLGRSGKELTPLIGHMQEAQHVVESFNYVLSDSAIKAANGYEKSINALGLAWDALVRRMGNKAIGVIEISGVLNDVQRLITNPPSGRDLLTSLGNPLTATLNAIAGNRFGPQSDTARVPQTNLFGNPAIPLEFDSSIYGSQAAARNNLLRQFDPEFTLKQAQQELKDVSERIANSHGPIDPLDRTRLATASSRVDAAKEQLAFPQQLKEAQEQLNRATDAQLTPLQKINAEYQQQIAALSTLKGAIAGQKDALTAVYTATRSARSGQEVVSAGRNFQLGQAQVQDLQDRLTLDATQRAAQHAANLAIINGGDRAGIEAAFQARTTANDQDHAQALASIARDRGNVALLPAADRKKAEEDLEKREIEETARARKEADDAAYQREEKLAELQRKDNDAAESAARRITSIQIELTKSLGSISASRKSGPFDATAAQEVAAEMQKQLQVALQVFNADQQAAALEQDANKRKELNAANLATLAKELYSIQVKGENDVYDLQKRRYEEAQQSAHSLAGALLTPGGLSGFIREQSRGFSTQVLGNILTPAVQSFGNSASGLFPSTGFLGSALKGTFLQPHDEQNITLSANSKATIDNTQATAALAKIMVDMANGRTPQTPNLPGVPALSGTAGAGSYGPTVASNPLLQNLLAPLLGAGVGASLGHSLASQFSPASLINITNDKKTFDPRYTLTHEGATIAGGVAGAGLGILSDLTRHTTPTITPGGSGVAQLVPIAQQQLDALQTLVQYISAGAPGASGLPVSINGVGNLSIADLPGLSTTSLANPLAGLNGVFSAAFGPSPSGSAYPSSGGDAGLDNLPSFGSGATGSSLAIQAAAATSSLTSTLSSFGKALAGGPANFIPAITGSATQANGQPFSTASRVGSIVGTGAEFLGAGLTAARDFKLGGAGADLSGTAAILGAAASIPSPASPFLAGGALVTGLLGSLLGNNKTKRQQQINTALAQEQWIGSTPINETTDTRGNTVIFGSDGKPVSTTGQGVTINPAQSYYNPNTGSYSTIPGTYTPNVGATISPTQAQAPSTYQTPAAQAQPLTLHIHALDAQSILDRSEDVASSVMKALSSGHAIGQRIQSVVLGS